MKKLSIFFMCVLTMSFSQKTHSVFFLGGQKLSLITVFSGWWRAEKPVVYDAINESELEGLKRRIGINDMSIHAPGYRPIDLIKDGVCKHPTILTMFARFLPETNVLVQRWACVKNSTLYVSCCVDPITDTLTVKSSLLPIQVSGLMDTQIFPLERWEQGVHECDKTPVRVVVNGRESCVRHDETLAITPNVNYRQALAQLTLAELNKNTGRD